MNEVLMPVKDTLVDGVYTRVIYMKAGTAVVGCVHNQGGTAVVLTGSCTQFHADGSETLLKAPLVFNTEAGSQKHLLILEDCLYATMHSTTATTTEEAERIIATGPPQLTRIRNSYNQLLLSRNTTDAEIREKMEKLPTIVEDSDLFYIGQSAIQGIGCFSKKLIPKGSFIAMSVIKGERMATARYINHSDRPNVEFIDHEDGESIIVIAKFDIQQDNELVLDYSKRI